MIITVDSKKMVEALTVIKMTGHYRYANVAKKSSIGETGVLIVRENGVSLINASSTIAAQMTIPLIHVEEPGECMMMFNINKMTKYIKNLNASEATIELGDSMFRIISSNTHIEMPASIEHPALPFITKLNTMEINHEQLPSFNKMQLEAQLVIEGKVLSDAIKSCSTIGDATYQLEYTKESDNDVSAKLSSGSYPSLDTVTVELSLLAHMGVDAKVQFSAPLDKFCDGIMWIYMKNDSPLLLVGSDRRLIMAPYIGR